MVLLFVVGFSYIFECILEIVSPPTSASGLHTSAPGFAHICAGTAHICAGTAYICTGLCPHLRRDCRRHFVDMARGMDIDLQLISHQVQGVGVIGNWLLAQQQDEQNKRHIENLMSTLTQVARPKGRQG
jgi:hypothetical protein